MIKKFGNKILKYGSRLTTFSLGMDIEIKGYLFPSASTSFTRYVFTLQFSSATSVIIDYGNGAVINYATKGTNNQVAIIHPGTSTVNLTTEYSYYEYPDGLNKDRTIRVIVTEPNKLILFQINTAFAKVQPLRVKFDQFPNLQKLILQFLELLDIDDSYLRVNSITEITMRNAFNVASRYSGAIPIYAIAGKSYVRFSWGDTGFSNKAFSVSNLDKIATNLNLSVLKELALTSSQLLDNNGGDGGLPANFNLLSLDLLDIQQNLYTTVPTVVNSMVSLKELNIQVDANLTSLGDFRNLVNLTTLYIGRCPNLAITLPSWFNSLVKLKTIDYRALGINDATKVDLWVTEFYNFTVTNAAMTGASTLPFRGMRIRIEDFTPFQSAIPGGTYQQPTGYVAGSSNGTPASSLERIWVLSNQYLHIWTYRTI